MPGSCSDEGVGEIMKFIRDDEDRAWCTVSYVLDKRIETGIDQKRITVTIMPWKDTTSKKRVGREVQPIENEEGKFVTKKVKVNSTFPRIFGPSRTYCTRTT